MADNTWGGETGAGSSERGARETDPGVSASERRGADNVKDSLVNDSYGGWDAFNAAVRSIDHRSIGERTLGLRETMVQDKNGVVTTEWSGIDFSPLGALAGMALGGPIGMVIGSSLSSVDPTKTTIGFDGSFSPYVDPLGGAGKAVQVARQEKESPKNLAGVIERGGVPRAQEGSLSADIRNFFVGNPIFDKIKLPN